MYDYSWLQSLGMLVVVDFGGFGRYGGQTASLLGENFLVLNSFDICRLGRELINLRRPGNEIKLR